MDTAVRDAPSISDRQCLYGCHSWRHYFCSGEKMAEVEGLALVLALFCGLLLVDLHTADGVLGHGSSPPFSPAWSARTHAVSGRIPTTPHGAEIYGGGAVAPTHCRDPQHLVEEFRFAF